MRPATEAVGALAAMIEAAERPVFVAGRGGRGAGPQIAALAQQAGALVATSAVANGLFEAEEFRLGISGGFSSPVAAELIAGADLVVGWGCALNMWTMRHGSLIGEGARVVQVDDDDAALGAHRPVDLGVHGDCAATARDVAASLSSGRTGYRTPEVAERLRTARWWNQTPTDDLSNVDPADLRRAVAFAEAVVREATLEGSGLPGHRPRVAQRDRRHAGSALAARRGGHR